MVTLQNFDKIITDFKILHSNKKESVLSSPDSFSTIVNEFKTLKEVIYTVRIKSLNRDVLNNIDLFRLSTFELMEHNFRENSHSNILQYLFDFNNLGDESVTILQKIISTKNTDVSNLVSSNFAKKNYQVFREYSTEKGRIDLLISDRVNKFNIIIENKLLAEISVKEINDKNEVTKTQLDDYYDYINSKFPDYKNLFFLLSYYSYEEEVVNYEKVNYELIYSALNASISNDVVLNEYKSLLISLLTGIDKRSVSSSIQKIKNNIQIELNSIEKINKIIAYETKQNRF